jgi:catechol 2,3-dioxygenase-like lactoylglutathione lyase family enzyme
VPVGAGGVIHVNVNCTDLTRSLAFYRDEIGLTAATRTVPEAPQPGTAFGLDMAQWDAWMMGGPDGFRATVVDLLEWKVPRPVARGPEPTLGFRRLRLSAPGATARATVDPDGTALDVEPGPGGPWGVVVACSDPARSRAFYDEVVGLGSFVELVADPGAAPAPPGATTVGIWRLALGTEDIDADVATLRSLGIGCVSDVAALSMGPGLPLLRFVLFPDPDGTMLELIERPRPAA